MALIMRGLTSAQASSIEHITLILPVSLMLLTHMPMHNPPHTRTEINGVIET